MSGNKFSKAGITLLAGLAATLATPALTAQAAQVPTTGQWSLIMTYETASQFACRVPDSGGNAINSHVTDLPTGVTMGLVVYDSAWAVVDEWSSETGATGDVYLPKGKAYTLFTWITTGGGEGGGLTKFVSTPDLARC